MAVNFLTQETILYAASSVQFQWLSGVGSCLKIKTAGAAETPAPAADLPG
jgi:hypothetical protein